MSLLYANREHLHLILLVAGDVVVGSSKNRTKNVNAPMRSPIPRRSKTPVRGRYSSYAQAQRLHLGNFFVGIYVLQNGGKSAKLDQ